MQEKLLLLRMRHNYSQEYMASVIEVSSTQYGQKERGAYEFKSDEMFKISELFDERLEDIFMPRSHRFGDKKKVK